MLKVIIIEKSIFCLLSTGLSVNFLIVISWVKVEDFVLILVTYSIYLGTVDLINYKVFCYLCWHVFGL